MVKLRFNRMTLLLVLIAHDIAAQTRPSLTVPTLTQVRDILALLEAPIISTLVSRAALPSDASHYSDDNGQQLLSFINPREKVASASGRFDYGTLEYPFTLPIVSPDHNSSADQFPGGRFHQDTFSPNPNITAFYVQTLIPLLEQANQAAGGSSVFFHLNNSSAPDQDAKYNLDATLLALLSHRASIGKIVAESKYAANVSGFIPLIQSQDVDQIRTLLTNTTQETVVLSTASIAASAVATAWELAQGASNGTASAFVQSIQNAVAKLFRELIDITTDVEIQYILQRLN